MMVQRLSATVRLSLVVFVAGVVTILLPGSALATTAYGSWSYYYSGSIQYGDRTDIAKVTPGPNWTAGIFVGRVTGAAVGPGWLGADPRLYAYNGALCYASGWRWNGSPSTSLYSSTNPPVHCGTTASYFSQGTSAAWDGNSGYIYHTPLRSPNQ
jgi:hypothetical protein